MRKAIYPIGMPSKQPYFSPMSQMYFVPGHASLGHKLHSPNHRLFLVGIQQGKNQVRESEFICQPEEIIMLHFISLFKFSDKHSGIDQSILCLHTSIIITFKSALTLFGPESANGYLDTSEPLNLRAQNPLLKHRIRTSPDRFHVRCRIQAWRAALGIGRKDSPVRLE